MQENGEKGVPSESTSIPPIEEAVKRVIGVYQTPPEKMGQKEIENAEAAVDILTKKLSSLAVRLPKLNPPENLEESLTRFEEIEAIKKEIELGKSVAHTLRDLIFGCQSGELQPALVAVVSEDERVQKIRRKALRQIACQLPLLLAATTSENSWYWGIGDPLASLLDVVSARTEDLTLRKQTLDWHQEYRSFLEKKVPHSPSLENFLATIEKLKSKTSYNEE